jgi:hypothetical protein
VWPRLLIKLGVQFLPAANHAALLTAVCHTVLLVLSCPVHRSALLRAPPPAATPAGWGLRLLMCPLRLETASAWCAPRSSACSASAACSARHPTAQSQVGAADRQADRQGLLVLGALVGLLSLRIACSHFASAALNHYVALTQPAPLVPCPPVPRRAGQALYLSNHVTRVETPLLRPPSPGTSGAGGIPGWVLPVAVVLAGGDAASSLLDPALPLILAGAVVATVGTGTWLLVVIRLTGAIPAGLQQLMPLLRLRLTGSAVLCSPPCSQCLLQASPATACCCRA